MRRFFDEYSNTILSVIVAIIIVAILFFIVNYISESVDSSITGFEKTASTFIRNYK